MNGLKSRLRDAIWNALSVRVYLKVLGIGLLVAGLMSALTIYLYFQAFSSELRGELAERGEALAALAAHEAQSALHTGAQQDLEARLEALVRSMPDAAYILVHVGADTLAQALAPAYDGAAGPDAETGGGVLVSHAALDAPVPAVVTVGMSTARTQAKLRAALVSGAIWLAAWIALSGALILALAYLLVRPIRHLLEVTTSLQQGNYETRAKVLPSDEIGKLAQAFNDLAVDLQLRRREVEETEATRASLIQHMIQSQEAERKMLARNLHDEIGQTLSHILIEMQRTCNQCLNAPQLCDGLRGLIDEARRLAWDFRPSILDDYGLEIALKRYAEERCGPMDIRVNCEAVDLASTNGRSRRLPPEAEVTLYRIAQEAVTNIVRHAGAKHVSIVLLKGSDEAMLIVEDDGRGFDLSNAAREGEPPLGLIGMRERAELMGGELLLDSSVGKGTTLRVSLPYQQVPA